MYIPKHFKIDDEGLIFHIIENNSFATLFSYQKGEPYATHLPLVLNKEKTALYGHFSKPNLQWEDSGDQLVLAVFLGPHCYISPTYYETLEAVPTWNYVTVHVYGNLEIIKKDEEIFRSLDEQVKKYEVFSDEYDLKNLDQAFMERMLKGIVPFKINITKIEGKAKLSQNHPLERQELVIQHLEQTNDKDCLEIASFMKKNIFDNNE